MTTISIIDSHTGGEPTRLIVDGGPDLGAGPLSERLARFREQHDRVRSAVVCEPRGSDENVKERRSRIVPERLDDSGQRLCCDPDREELIEERVPHKEKWQTAGQEQPQDPDHGQRCELIRGDWVRGVVGGP